MEQPNALAQAVGVEIVSASPRREAGRLRMPADSTTAAHYLHTAASARSLHRAASA
jgi:hypothetical protein